jgi:hypothetical protein
VVKAVVFAVAKRTAADCGTATCCLLRLQGGELELSLLLGDPAAPLGLSGSLGSVLLPETATGAAAPKPKLLTAAHQPVNNMKPNIAHIFVSGSCSAPPNASSLAAAEGS